MSGPEKDLFNGPNQTACATCQAIHPTPEKALACREEHEKESRRERARRFARGGGSQFKKPEAAR